MISKIQIERVRPNRAREVRESYENHLESPGVNLPVTSGTFLGLEIVSTRGHAH
jgi:hypothetical protein